MIGEGEMVMEEELFRAWFSGFVAGEGCFIIHTKVDCRQFRTKLQIGLRDDDLDILIEIQERLQMGKIRRYAYQHKRVNANPGATWTVVKQADCQKLVEIFQKYPLRAKKQKDFEIWREAVAENTKSIKQRNLGKLRYLHDKLKLVRQYEPVEELVYKPEGIQLALPEREEEED